MRSLTSSRRITLAVVVFVLWLVTVALTLWCVYALWQLFILLYAALTLHMGADARAGAVLANILLIVLALAGIAFIVISGEYHRRFVGQMRSWRALTLTLAIQIVIALIYALMEAR
ncbi:MAG: hypothetical protein RMN25_05275 [Anaerolineae bacterium]|nr:hypothetical protein [Thermoflexales bacterium]MDW8407177.1 hypothetical protein [Anaerolineae bacterium]